MKNHKVIDVLKSFDQKTSKKFLHYLQSPFTGRTLKAMKLGEYLLSFYPDFEDERLNEKDAYNTLALDKPFSKQELVRYLSKLLSVIEDFIAINSQNKVPYLKGNLLAEYYYHTKNEIGFNRVIKQNNKLLTSSQVDSTNYFYLYLNNKLAHNYSLQHRKIKEANQYLDGAIPALDNYYILQLLQSAVAYIYNKEKEPDTNTFPLLPSVIAYLEANQNTCSALVLLWFWAYKLVLQPDEQRLYQVLKQTLLIHIKNVSPIDAHNIVVVLNNASARKRKNNRSWYVKERFDIYQIEINEGWVIAKGIISYMTFNNIIAIALALSKVAFANTFLNHYKDYLLPETREDIVLYNKARIAFIQKDFKSSLLLAQQVGYFDESVAIGVKRLQAMCHLELGNYDQLTHILNSLKMYLYRLEGFAESLKDRNYQFMKVVGFLSKHEKGIPDQKTYAAVHKIISDRQLIPEMEWIEEKLSLV